VSQRAERRRRKQRRHAGADAGGSAEPPPEDDSTGGMGAGYARSRAKDDAARAALEPLEPGERPRAVTIAALVTGALGLVNFVAYLLGLEVRDERPNLVGILLFTGLMLGAAWGAWRARYWAVLGIQALLALTVLIFSLLAIRSENVGALLIALGIIAAAGTLFWFLVKAMARIQMPERPGAG